ncbi:MAG: precorrin-4 C(11)-methyltransferase [Candidatus Hydrothermarchaeota archaeon]
MKVYFIGAGPGDPDLLTIKAKKVIEESDVIIYAGSLINPEILKYAKKDADLFDSSGMTLEEIKEVIYEAVNNKKTVARIHSGDPSIYGAIQEQIDFLEEKKIEFEIIPGVSSFLSAAASLKREYTIPEVSQTLIITRISGRTKVPEKESLRELSRHKASMCIFLSAHMIDEVVNELINFYDENTPVAVVYKASLPDEKIVHGNLGNIAEKVKNERIERKALILVGDFLMSKGKRSKLYDKDFTHSFRDNK